MFATTLQDVEAAHLAPLQSNTSPLSTHKLISTVQQRSQPGPSSDKEKSRRRSCRECQRLKLKCDRVFPCSSCRKRGTQEICPEGALISGRGSRFILANTEQLHDKILQLSERVRQLEDGLGALQATVSPETHPLLAPDLLRIKISQDLYVSSPQIDSPGVHGGETSFATALSLNASEPVPSESSRSSSLTESPPPEVPPDVLQLSSTFPFPWTVNLKIRKLIRDALPQREAALAICQQAQSNALWQYNLDASQTFMQNLLHHCYESPVESLSPRRLALLLMILSIGSLVDLNRPLGSLHGEAYHHLARASVCEIPLMEEPDFDVLHALFFMIWYHLIFSDNNKAVGYAWNLLGFVAKLAQGLGLHRGGRIKLIPEEHEKRRLVFWELMHLDTRMSLSLGRPPSIYLGHVDIKPPSYTAQGLYVPREEIIYHEWKNSFMIQCLNPILEAMIAVDPPDYAYTVELDGRVRNFYVPAELDTHNPDVSRRFLNMQRALVASGIDIALLQLHRRYFTETMNGPFDFNHRYAPSVLATYLSASSLIATVETLYEREQQLSVRFLCFWFNSFSAAVTLSLFVSRIPSNPLAPFALQDLDRVCRLFRRAAQILPFSGKSLPAMERLTERARHAYLQWRNSINPEQSLYFPSPTVQTSQGGYLPNSFFGTHPSLTQHVMRLTSSESPFMGSFPSFGVDAEPTPYLPDIYHFNSNGVALDERYTFAQKQPTPFMPSSPRIDEHETFNFDHGAITAELEETSYMAWF